MRIEDGRCTRCQRPGHAVPAWPSLILARQRNQRQSHARVVRPRLDANFFLTLAIVPLSFVFGKNCLIMDYLGFKDSSRQLWVNCAINYSFYLYLMLHICAARFDVTENLENF